MKDIGIDQLLRENRKTLSIQITKDAKLVVKAPRLMPMFVINQFIESKQDWIRKKLTPLQATQHKREKKYIAGEEFLYMGKNYRLTPGPYQTIAITDDQLLFPHVLLFRAHKELTSWFQKQAKDVITRRVAYHAEKMQTQYTKIFFSDTSSKWGTCFADNTLQFNWRLIMAPIFVIDYVVIHELAHTKEKNHSDKFWDIVATYTPAYKTHRRWLSQNGHLLTT